MTGFNLPPGYSVSDIPGNQPEDLAAEAIYDAIYERFPEITEADAGWIFDRLAKAYGEGYQRGVADAEYAHEMSEGLR